MARASTKSPQMNCGVNGVAIYLELAGKPPTQLGHARVKVKVSKPAPLQLKERF